MNSGISISSTGWASRIGRLARLLPLLAMALFLGSSLELRAQDAVPFTYVTNHNAITITGYSGPGGAVTIPANLNGLPVTRIGDRAFINRAGLTQISLPTSLTSMGRGTFLGSGLTQITLPNNLTVIGGDAFMGCTSLTQIILPNSLTTLAEGTFSGCASLTQITLPDSLTTLGESAFSECTGLTQISFPNSLTTIKQGAFVGCTGLTQISLPNSLTTLEGLAFSDCTGLTQITLPNSLTTLGEGAFFGCAGLTAIEISNANPNYSTVDGVLFDKHKTTILRYPEGRAGTYTLPDSVTSIGSVAFSGCTGLTQISLPNSLTSIEYGAFSGCTGLTQITLPESLTSIGEEAFSGCSGLTQITLHDSLTSVGEWAFLYCRNLRFVRFQGNAPSVEYPMFADVTVLYLPGTTGWAATFSGAPTTLWLPAIGRPTTAGGLPDGSFGFPVDWAPQRQVNVEACADLTHPDWQPVATLTLDATGTAQFSDPAAASHPNRLYRLRTP